MTKPNIRMDWTINIGSIGAALIFLLGCLGSWYNLKGEVATNKATSEIRLQQLDAGLAEVKSEVRAATTEIKGDIRDLRSDIRQSNNNTRVVVSPGPRSEELRNR